MTLPFLRLAGIRKSFGSVHALDGVDFTVQSHELIGLVGHNGAGKSTLMHVLAGTLTADEGTILIDDVPAAYGLGLAQAAGVRCVFQELSLCPNLSVLENTRLVHRRLVGMGWRRRAAGLIREQLDAIFPDHGIDTNTIVHDLPIGERQMVEIARAFTITEAPPRLVILDEPTSSLDAHRTSQLLAYLERSVETGLSCIMISHMLGEILGHADRIVVMRDGTVVADGPAGEFDRERLVVAMGGHEREPVESARSLAVRDAPEVVHARFAGACTDLVAHAGEIIGLAGLAGHGQTAALLAVFDASGKDVQVQGEVALVAGDRQRDGVFPRASISANMVVSSLAGAAAGAVRLRGARGRAGHDLAAAHRHPHAGPRAQHPDPLGRQSAKGAVRSRTRREGADHPDGRPDARRRHRHQARGLRADPCRGRSWPHLPLVHDRDRGARSLRSCLCVPQRHHRRRARRQRGDRGPHHREPRSRRPPRHERSACRHACCVPLCPSSRWRWCCSRSAGSIRARSRISAST